MDPWLPGRFSFFVLFGFSGPIEATSPFLLHCGFCAGLLMQGVLDICHHLITF